ncbi:MAG TPA: hypothetical protein VFA75_14780 [Nevskia sp.]|nr:hypothetical protein [Nevskia sp.]
MLLLTPEEAAVFELLDPSSSRRLVLGRTGRAFVWDPTQSTREVPFQAAQALVKAGVVGPGGRIAPEHLAQWGKPPSAQGRKAKPAPAAGAERKPAPAPVPPPRTPAFERTLPLGYTVEALRAV